REVAVAAVVLARDVGEHPKLRRGKQAVGNGHAKHRRMALDVQAVAKAKGAELVFRELSGEEALRLVAELRDAFGDEGVVVVVVAVHGQWSTSLVPAKRSTATSEWRTMRSGRRAVSWEPTRIPGIEPTSRLASSQPFTLPSERCPRPASSVIG